MVVSVSLQGCKASGTAVEIATDCVAIVISPENFVSYLSGSTESDSTTEATRPARKASQATTTDINKANVVRTINSRAQSDNKKRRETLGSKVCPGSTNRKPT